MKKYILIDRLLGAIPLINHDGTIKKFDSREEAEGYRRTCDKPDDFIVSVMADKQ